VERVQTRALEVVVELFDSRLVRDGRIGERAGAVRVGRILARSAVDEIELLGRRVVRLEVLIREWPGGGDAGVVPHFAEIALAETEEDRPVDLRVAADVVLRVWPKRNAVLVVPELGRHITLPAEDLLRVPVLGFARQVATAFEQQDPLAGRGEPVRERAAAGAGADDDDVVMVAHFGASLR
jgi:hypothetical protein